MCVCVCVCVNVSVYLQQAGWQSHTDRGANEPHTVATHTHRQAGQVNFCEFESEVLRVDDEATH